VEEKNKKEEKTDAPKKPDPNVIAPQGTIRLESFDGENEKRDDG